MTTDTDKSATYTETGLSGVISDWAADKQAFIDAAKEGTKANRARVDEDDAKGVADLRAKGMTVIDNVDKAKFVAALAPVNAEFEKQFGKAAIDKIRDVK